MAVKEVNRLAPACQERTVVDRSFTEDNRQSQARNRAQILIRLDPDHSQGRDRIRQVRRLRVQGPALDPIRQVHRHRHRRIGAAGMPTPSPWASPSG